MTMQPQTPINTGELYKEIRTRNELRVRHWIRNNKRLFKNKCIDEIIRQLQKAGILTNWFTIFCPVWLSDAPATALCELDDVLLHPEELRRIES